MVSANNFYIMKIRIFILLVFPEPEAKINHVKFFVKCDEDELKVYEGFHLQSTARLKKDVWLG